VLTTGRQGPKKRANSRGELAAKAWVASSQLYGRRRPASNFHYWSNCPLRGLRSLRLGGFYALLIRNHK
jgi:hypothetical protein